MIYTVPSTLAGDVLGRLDDCMNGDEKMYNRKMHVSIPHKKTEDMDHSHQLRARGFKRSRVGGRGLCVGIAERSCAARRDPRCALMRRSDSQSRAPLLGHGQQIGGGRSPHCATNKKTLNRDL
ncbi:unnamed protein product [Lampetra fluviatilis]